MAETSARAPQRLSHEDYFALEQSEDWRYEYIAGEVFAMTGGSEAHALISMNAGVALAHGLRDKPCRVYGSDMKLYIASHDKFCYPDVMVLCEQGKRRGLYVEDPVMLVEVLSPATESYDRGLKFEHYRSIEALRYYLLLNQDRVHAELFQKEQAGTWRLSEATGADAILHLQEWDLALKLSELYRQVELG
jgi:Uma2 family endonuclease